MNNISIDYLARIIPQSSSKNLCTYRWNDVVPFNICVSLVLKDGNKIVEIIGNETKCQDDSDSKIPCNGKLKPNTNYK
jgi:hypothetical protein